MSRGASSDDDLRINTLHRFAKHSPRLTLQEYSHCEVPAGCGGVVLRWVDPRRGVPIRVRAIVLGETETWLDGAPLPGGHTRIEAGTHVLAVHVTNLGKAAWSNEESATILPAPFVLDVLADHGPNAYHTVTDLLAQASAVERRWTSTPPAPDFMQPSFDERGWNALRPASPTMLAGCAAHVQRAYDRLRESGATVLALGDADRDGQVEAWVRMRFTLHDGALRELGSPARGG